MKTIWIATSNQHKVEEFKKMLPEYNVKCLKDLDQKIEIIENGTTFEENAICKAKSLYDVLHQPVISDDSGIEVDAMDKKPGVYSARWMGENTSYEIKNQAIIDAVKGKVKTARYVCVIAYIDEMGNAHTYRGEVEGLIHSCPVGENGFGYDPIFYYPPFHTTLANVSDEMKNSISHRGKALELFLEDLNRGKDL
ncbi:MAG: RdgB/HAM1 family non-canonical purine NTP pyrophosphatase [Floccifex porci]|uniref:RdgB/HAM1 family non-canonical purine NTP pyrophosphatase n=1 Tax=Floccifex porci TaxID=2606629 RepID=UPI0023F12710|nr:RdgB/HAM1 family non-canonical purine NTP pyrophosphatase [Floccifex porci]MDD7467728.1 RdgB/HAM1 family non-canonical purine NTP pyrophosphatase [Floccifex porci]